MRYIILLLSALLGIMLSRAAPLSDDFNNPLAKYTIVDLEWNVPVSPDRNDTVIGTIQDVANHLATVDPEGFPAVNNSIKEAVADPYFDHATASYRSSDSTEEYKPLELYCNIFQGSASGLRIKWGIEYLRKIIGTPGEGPGPNSCGRVSCSHGAAIYWCNENNYDLVLESYSRIADGAQLLITGCCFIQDDATYGVFNGVQYFGGNWNVVVQHADC